MEYKPGPSDDATFRELIAGIDFASVENAFRGDHEGVYRLQERMVLDALASIGEDVDELNVIAYSLEPSKRMEDYNKKYAPLVWISAISDELYKRDEFVAGRSGGCKKYTDKILLQAEIICDDGLEDSWKESFVAVLDILLSGEDSFNKLDALGKVLAMLEHEDTDSMRRDPVFNALFHAACEAAVDGFAEKQPSRQLCECLTFAAYKQLFDNEIAADVYVAAAMQIAGEDDMQSITMVVEQVLKAIEDAE